MNIREKINHFFSYIKKSLEKCRETRHRLNEKRKKFHETRIKAQKIAQPFIDNMKHETIQLPIIPIKIQKKRAVISAFIGIHLLEFWVTQYFFYLTQSQNQENSTVQMKEQTPEQIQNQIQKNEYFWKIALAIGNILIGTSIMSLKQIYAFYLRRRLEISVKAKMLKDWIDSGASSGMTYLQDLEPETMLPIHEIFSNHVASFSRGITHLTNISGDSISISMHLYYLHKFYNRTIFVFSAGYWSAFVFISGSLFQKAYEDLFKKVSELDAEVHSQVITIEKFGSQLSPNKIQIDNLMTAIKNREALAKINLMINLKSQVFNGVSQTVYTPLLDIMLPELRVLHFLDISSSYQFNYTINIIVNKLFSIVSDSNASIAESINGLEQVDKFHTLMEKWKLYKALKLLKCEYQPHQQKLCLHQFKVHIFDSEKKETIEQASQLLKKPNLIHGRKNHGIDFHFQKGKVYLFPDLSGTGKTTILKAMLGMYPLASGMVTYPCKSEEIRFLSRNNFLPMKLDLFEAILFPMKPRDKAHSEELMNQIKKYIYEIGFIKPEKHIAALNNKGDWLNKLSDGEKQRFAIINIFITKPKILVLDEALGNLDKPSKNKIEKLIKETLRDSVILYADHHPIPGFADYVVQINEGELTCSEAKKHFEDNNKNKSNRL